MSHDETGRPPAGWPVPDVTFVEAVTRGLAQYVHFDGRASRREFWYFFLFVSGVVVIIVAPTVAAAVSTSTTGRGPGAAFTAGLSLLGVFYAAVLLPTLAVACRRLHDAGYSGLFLLLALVTGVIPAIMCALPTSPEASRFGPPGPPASPYRQPGPYGSAPAYGPGTAYGSAPASGQPAAYGQPAPYGSAPAYGQPAPPDRPQPEGPPPSGPSAPQGYGPSAPGAYGQPWSRPADPGPGPDQRRPD